LTLLLQGLDEPTEVGLLLICESSFGHMPFLPPPMTPIMNASAS